MDIFWSQLFILVHTQICRIKMQLVSPSKIHSLTSHYLNSFANQNITFNKKYIFTVSLFLYLLFFSPCLTVALLTVIVSLWAIQLQRVSSALATVSHYHVPAGKRGNVLICRCCGAGVHVARSAAAVFKRYEEVLHMSHWYTHIILFLFLFFMAEVKWHWKHARVMEFEL